MVIQMLKMQGPAIQSMVNQTGMSRNTVKKYLNQKASCLIMTNIVMVEMPKRPLLPCSPKVVEKNHISVRLMWSV